MLRCVLRVCSPARFAWLQSLAVFGGSLVFAALLAAVKLAAIAGFLHHFPHLIDDPRVGGFGADVLSVASQLTIWRVAMACRLMFGSECSLLGYYPAELWESDVSVTPVAWLPLAWLVLRARPRAPGTQFWLRLGGVLLVAAAFVAIVTRHEVLVVATRGLPILRSFHANWRLASAVVLPLAIASGVSLSHVARSLDRDRRAALGIAFVGSALLTLWPFLKLRNHTEYTRFDPRPIEAAWNATRNGERFAPITNLAPIPDDRVFAARASNLSVYEPIFGYERPGAEFKTRLVPGPIWGAPDGRPNFHFVPSFTSPTARRFEVFAPAPAEETPRIRELLARRQPDWPLPASVQVGTFVSAAAGALLLLLAIYPKGKAARSAAGTRDEAGGRDARQR